MRILPLFFLAVCLFPHMVSAQSKTMQEFTEREKVGFAFYNLISREPPYDDWVRGMTEYQRAKANVQLSIMDHQRQRLRQGFAAFSPSHDVITLKLPVRVTGGDNPNAGTGAEKQITIDFMGGDKPIYFPFQLGNMWISLIPQGLEQRSSYPLSKHEFERFCEKRKSCEKFDQNLDVQIVLRAREADAEQPLVMHDVPLWLMMADVGALVFINRDSGTLWESVAPWYVTERNTSLMSLHGQ